MSKNLLIKLGASALVLSLGSIFALNTITGLQAQETDSTTIDDIEEDTTDVVGETVTVRGEVSDVEPGVSFTINEEGFLQGSEVLVVNVSGEMLPEAPEEDLKLQVTGEVGQFVYADAIALYDLDLDPDLYIDYEQEPVIFATSMALSPDLGNISDNPDFFYSKEVAVTGEVSEIKSDSAFVLSENDIITDDELLIIDVTGEAVPAEEQELVVTGIIRPFVVSELETDYDLTWDLDVQEELEAEYSEKPVLVVDTIYPSAE